MPTRQEKELKAKVLSLVQAGVSSHEIARRTHAPLHQILGIKYREVRIASHDLNQPYMYQINVESFNPDEEGGGGLWVHLLLPQELVAFAARCAESQGQSFHTYLADVFRREVHWQPAIPFPDTNDQ